MLEREPPLPNRWDRAVEHGAVQKSAIPHALLPEDRRDLDDGFDVVGRVEEGEALCEDGEEDDACGPDVDFRGLGGAFQEDFGGAEASGAGAVGTSGGSGVVSGVAGGDGLCCSLAELDFGPPGW